MQIEICKSLLDSNRRTGGCRINENEIAVTTDGFSCFVFYVKECIFDREKLPIIEALKSVCDDNEKDEPIKATGEMFRFGDKWLRKYEGENIELYADVKIASKFEGYNLYAFSELNRVLVKDEFGRKLGVFLPTRYYKK